MSGPENDRVLTYVDALQEAVALEMRTDERVFVMGLDVDDHKAIQGSTRGLVEEFGESRVFTTPLSEDAMTGIAIGAAMAGRRPIHVHIRMDFLMLCMNQLVNIAAKARYMYGGHVSVPLVSRAMIGKSWGQGAQHSQGLHSLFAHIPGLKVVAPSNAYDAKGLMLAAIRDPDPVIFVEHRLLYFTEAFVPEQPFEVEIGKARVLAEGEDITIVGVSNMAMEALRARELLAEVGISAEVVDPVSIQPLDGETIHQSFSKTKRLLVVDNGWTHCGVSGEIIARMAERSDVCGPMRRMGYAPTTCPATPWLEDHFYPNPATIAEMAHGLVKPDADAWKPDEKRSKLAYQTQFRGPF